PGRRGGAPDGAPGAPPRAGLYARGAPRGGRPRPPRVQLPVPPGRPAHAPALPARGPLLRGDPRRADQPGHLHPGRLPRLHLRVPRSAGGLGLRPRAPEPSPLRRTASAVPNVAAATSTGGRDRSWTLPASNSYEGSPSSPSGDGAPRLGRGRCRPCRRPVPTVGTASCPITPRPCPPSPPPA